MTDFIQKRAQDIEKNQKDLQTRPKVGILQKLAAQRRAFLVDNSGSMDERVKDGRKIDIVNGLLESLKEELQLTRLFTFSDTCQEIKISAESRIPEIYTEGGTAMHRAFEVMHQNQIKDIVLLTDGQPDVPEYALKSASGLKIDIVYIGPQPMPQFLKDLAVATGGTFQSQDMLKADSTLLLKSKLKGLLGTGSK